MDDKEYKELEKRIEEASQRKKWREEREENLKSKACRENESPRTAFHGDAYPMPNFRH